MKGTANSAMVQCEPRMWGGDIPLKSESFSGLESKFSSDRRERDVWGNKGGKNCFSYTDYNLRYHGSLLSCRKSGAQKTQYVLQRIGWYHSFLSCSDSRCGAQEPTVQIKWKRLVEVFKWGNSFMVCCNNNQPVLMCVTYECVCHGPLLLIWTQKVLFSVRWIQYQWMWSRLPRFYTTWTD